MNKNLKDKSEELEQNLLMSNCKLFKRRLKDWVKVGGLGSLLAALLTLP